MKIMLNTSKRKDWLLKLIKVTIFVKNKVMTQEQKKELLLKDLSARLPYGVKVVCETEKNLFEVEVITSNGCVCPKDKKCLYDIDVDEIKPYLFPLSSMTEEQKEELFFKYIHNDIYFDDFTDYFLAGELWHDIHVSMDILPELINWLNKNHLDYKGLIPMGLAIDATGLNVY